MLQRAGTNCEVGVAWPFAQLALGRYGVLYPKHAALPEIR